MDKIKIAVVEDEPVVAMDIVANIEHLGYQAAGPFDQAEEVISLVKTNTPDLVLMDINIAGKIDGVQAAREINRLVDIPIIFVTASTDKTTVTRAREVKPHAYIVKPFNFHNLQSSIELALYNYSCATDEPVTIPDQLPKTDGYPGNESLFVKNANSNIFEKLPLSTVHYLKAEGSYTRIVCTNDTFLMCANLQKILNRFSPADFQRVHRSYAVNINHIDKISGESLTLGEITVPLSQSYRHELFQKLNFL